MATSSDIPIRSRSVVSREVGQPRIVTSDYFIQEISKTELRMPRRLYTFDSMMFDDAVYACINFTNVLLTMGLKDGKCIGKTKKGEKLAEFVNYNLSNMSYGTWLQAIKNMISFIVYGWSDLNIVVEKRKYGKYKNSYCLKKLAPRDQKSVYGWVWDRDFRECLGFVQKPMLKSHPNYTNSFVPQIGITALQDGRYFESVYPFIKMDQLLHITYNSTNNNPQGSSPLLHCYQAWREKVLVSRYEVSGISRDLAGAIVLRVPNELIERANKPDEYPNEAREYVALQTDAAALHSGENSFILLSSATDEISKKFLYDITFQGVEGGGKLFETSKVIEQRNKAIYNSLGANFLLMGQMETGSYNLSTTGQSTHGFVVEDILVQIADAVQYQIVKRLLAVNKISVKEEDIPVFEYKDPSQYDRDVFGKLVQRLKSVGGLSPEALKHLYKEAGFPLDGVEDLDFDGKGTSRAGEGFGTSGYGMSTDVGAGDNNLENTGTAKALVKDTDGNIIDTETGRLITYQEV